MVPDLHLPSSNLARHDPLVVRSLFEVIDVLAALP